MTPHITDLHYTVPATDVESIKQKIVFKLIFTLGVDPKDAQPQHWLKAAMYAIRDLLTENWLKTRREVIEGGEKMVYYLSMEFLLGRSFLNSLINEEVYDNFKQAFKELGLNLTDVAENEEDPGLGNGGLGRLAACFLDSMATLGIPAMGYGIRYQYGMFTQKIENGKQVEMPDLWLENAMAWQFVRPSKRYQVAFGGNVFDKSGKPHWEPSHQISALGYDEVTSGYGGEKANTLRLWTAHAGNRFDLADFNRGEYFAAIAAQTEDENVSRVLYPDDSTTSGKELRLRQEYFLVSASVQDIIVRHERRFNTLDNLAEKVVIHLNDTHPVLAIPELIRILVDEKGYAFEQAWRMSQQIFSYTNHTLMSEALETWPVEMLARVIPRHLGIIYDINAHFLKFIEKKYPGDVDLMRRVSIIEEGNERRVRMAWLAVITAHKTNGVAKIHSELMKTSIFTDFAHIFPERFTNVTNGVTPRRWLAVANQPLTLLLDRHLGTETWRKNLDLLKQLEPLAANSDVQAEFAQVKAENKKRLADYIKRELAIEINPEALFDVQIKRIHEYKRQAMNVLHLIDRYNQILAHPEKDWLPRVFIFAGKAASAYYMAKKVIQLINDVANVINQDARIGNLIKVVFIPNYSVSLAEIIIPAADLSEQISLAGTEASGTSNMKFALNGALTIGTLDGANVEILEKVGNDHIFIFGHTVDEVAEIRANGYEPLTYLENDPDLRTVVRQVTTGVFSPDEPHRYADTIQVMSDYYQSLADFRSYVNKQQEVDARYKDAAAWRESALINIANMSHFSSDRSIRDYAENIWHVKVED